VRKEGGGVGGRGCGRSRAQDSLLVGGYVMEGRDYRAREEKKDSRVHKEKE